MNATDAFERSSAIAESWLRDMADRYALPPLDGCPQVENATAKVWWRRDDDSLAFAFTHRDNADATIEWHVLAGVTRTETGAVIETEVAAEGAGYNTPPLRTPYFLAKIVADVGVVDVFKLSATPERVTRENVARFIALLNDASRTLPIVAFSDPLPLDDEEVTRFAARVAGAAHVVVIDVDASFSLSDSVGRMRSVFKGAVRVYPPPPLPENAYDLKLYFPATIQRYNEMGAAQGIYGAIRFADVLARSTLDRRMWASTKPLTTAEPATHAGTAAIGAGARIVERIETAEPSLVLESIAREAKGASAASETPAEGAGNSDKVLELTMQVEDLSKEVERLNTALVNAEELWFGAQTQLEKLQAEQEASSDLAVLSEGLTGEDAATMQALYEAFAAVKKMAERTSAAEAQARSLRDVADDQRIEIGNMKIRLAALEARDAKAAEDKPVRPTDYREVAKVEEFLLKAHNGCVVLHANAKRTLAEGVFEDSERVLDMLEILGTRHHAMQTGTAGAYEAFNAAIVALRVKSSAVLRSDSSIGEYGHHYEVTDERGRRVKADEIKHLRVLGETYAPERMAAIYYYWDEERKVTVITSGPRKLPTAADGT